MMDKLDPDELEPVNSGLPVTVRFISGEDVICIAYKFLNSDDPRLILERPLTVVFEDVVDDHKTNNTNFTRVRSRFERWMPLSNANEYPIYIDHVLSIAPLLDTLINSYMETSHRLYTLETYAEKLTTTPSTHTEQDMDEIRQSYFDFVLHNFKPKGRPN